MCPTSAWLSSTSIICVVPPGTGSGLSARVQLMQCPPGAEPQTTSPESCRFYSEFGVSRAFSYDKPSVSGITPNNAAPSGYSLVTINGINFGPFLDDPWRVERQDPATIDALVPVTLPVASGIQVCARARLCCCMSARLPTPCTHTLTHTHTHSLSLSHTHTHNTHARPNRAGVFAGEISYKPVLQSTSPARQQPGTCSLFCRRAGVRLRQRIGGSIRRQSLSLYWPSVQPPSMRPDPGIVQLPSSAIPVCWGHAALLP